MPCCPLQLVSELHESAAILHEEYCETGTLITAFMPHSMASRFQSMNLLAPAESSDAEGELVGV